MTLEELKQRCVSNGFQYAYGGFENEVEPPHLVTISTDTANFMADNRVYLKRTPIKMDYTYLKKDVEEQNKIEDKILGDLPWNKTEETYLTDEQVWQVSYFFEI